MSNINRETWLEKAVELLRPFFKEKGYELPEQVRVSCGWPSHGALAEKNRVMGQCIEAEGTVDGVKQVYISPLLSTGLEVLGVLVHELGHVALPDGTSHKKPFKKFCKAVGLEGPATHTMVGLQLYEFLYTLLGDDPIFGLLPDYPQGKVVLKEKVKKQTTRMHKLVCRKNDDHPENEIVVRAAKKTLALGIPMCFCGKEFEVEENQDNESE